MKLNKGFSLLELLVVVSVIAILTAIGFPIYTRYSNQAKVQVAYNYGMFLSLQHKQYYEQHGDWPPTINVAGTTLNSGSCMNPQVANIGQLCNLYGYSYGPGYGFAALQVCVTGLSSDVANAYNSYQTPNGSNGLAACFVIASLEVNKQMLSKCGGGAMSLNYIIPHELAPACTCWGSFFPNNC